MTNVEGDTSDSRMRLLEGVPNKVRHRLIVRYPYRSDGEYAFFYHEAAKRLASTYRGDPIDDTILMPLLMLYRQAFELGLKQLIRRLGSVRSRHYEPGNKDLASNVIDKKLRSLKFGHRLEALLDEAITHLRAIGKDSEFPQSLKDVISAFHADDPSGTAFRYSGQLPDSQEFADFPDLAALLDEQIRLLGSFEDWIEATYEAQYDARRDAESELDPRDAE